MKKRPKIWQTEDQILAAIDRTRRMAQRQLMKSKLLEEKAKEKFGKCEEIRFTLMRTDLTEIQRQSQEGVLVSWEMSAGKTKEAADQCAKAYHRAINSTLPRLGEILSAFRTQTMPEILGEHKAVAVR